MTTDRDRMLATIAAGLKRLAEHLLGGLAVRPDALDRFTQIPATVIAEVKGFYVGDASIDEEADAIGTALQSLEDLFANWRAQIEGAHADALRRDQDDGADP